MKTVQNIRNLLIECKNFAIENKKDKLLVKIILGSSIIATFLMILDDFLSIFSPGNYLSVVCFLIHLIATLAYFISSIWYVFRLFGKLFFTQIKS